MKSKEKLFRGKMMIAVVLTVLMVVMTLVPTMALAESDNGGGDSDNLIVESADDPVIPGEGDPVIPGSDDPVIPGEGDDVIPGADPGSTEEPTAPGEEPEATEDSDDASVVPVGDAVNDITGVSATPSLTSYRTFEDLVTSLIPPPLTVTVGVTLGPSYQNNSSGGTIELPLDFTPTPDSHPNFTTDGNGHNAGNLDPFFTLNTAVLDAPDFLSTYDFIDSFDYSDPTKLVIHLKPGLGAGVLSVPISFTFNDNYRMKVPVGTTLWEVYAAAYVDGVLAQTSATTAVETSATTSLVPKFTRLNPTNNQYVGGALTVRLNIYNNSYYESDFDPTYLNTIWFEVPTGTTVDTDTKDYYNNTPQINIDGSGYDRYSRYVANQESDWNFWQVAGDKSDVYSQNSLILTPPSYSVGETFQVRSGWDYRKINGESIPSNPTATENHITYTKAEQSTYGLSLSTFHGKTAAEFPICRINDGDYSPTAVFSTGISYPQPNSTKNLGTASITGFSHEFHQPATGSEKLNFRRISVYINRDVSEPTWSQYRATFKIKSAIGGDDREVISTLISETNTYENSQVIRSFGFTDSLSGIHALPSLSTGEYIDQFILTPMGTDGLHAGELPPLNGFGVEYVAKAWDGQKWPDGTTVSNQQTIVTMGASDTYFDDPAMHEGDDTVVVTNIHDDFRTYYVGDNVPYAQAALISSTSSGVNPGGTVSYEVQGYNNSTYTSFAWKNPKVVVRVPKYMTLVAPEGEKVLTDVSTGYPITYPAQAHQVSTTDADYNYYSFTASGYEAPTIASTSAVFKIDVQFKVDSSTPVGTYDITRVMVSSEIGSTFWGSYNLPMNNGDLIAEKFGFDITSTPRENYSISTRSSTSLGVIGLPRLSVSSAVKSEAVTDFVGPPTVTVPAKHDETTQMRLRITNAGNSTYNSIKLYDILPYSGDPLLSTGSVTFAGVAVTGATPTIRYGTAADAPLPTYGTHGAALQTDGAAGAYNLKESTFQNTWALTAPSTASDTKAVFIDFGNFELLPGKSVDIVLSFTIPSGLSTETAYNQFRYSAQEKDSVNPPLNDNNTKQGFSTATIGIEYLKALPSTFQSPMNDDFDGLPAMDVWDFTTGPQNKPVNTATGPTLSGYTFAGWGTAESGDAVTYAQGSASDITFNAAGTTSLYTKWTANPIAVLYDTNGTTLAPAESFAGNAGSDTASYGGKITDPGNPARFGSTFKGWFDSRAKANDWANQTAWNFGSDVVTTPISGDKTLYAAWEEAAYTLTFTAGTGANFTSAAQTRTYNQNPSDGIVPTIDSSVGAAAGYNPATAVWKANKAVTLNDSSVKAADTALTRAQVLTVKARENVTFTASLTAIDYTITYSNVDESGVGGVFGANKPLTYKVTDSAKPISDPTRAGYTFDGWTVTGVSSLSGNANKNVNIPNGNTGNVTLTANWSVQDTAADWVTVTFDGNDGGAAVISVAGLPAAILYNKTLGAWADGTVFPSSAPTRAGYTFKTSGAGWNTADDGTGDNVTTLDGIKTSLTLGPTSASEETIYAQWDFTSGAVWKTVTFSGNAGGATVGNLPSDLSYNTTEKAWADGTGFPSSAPTRAGYTFKTTGGWTANADGSGATFANLDDLATPGNPLADNKTIYAQWDFDVTQTAVWKTVTFDGNGSGDLVGNLPAVLYYNTSETAWRDGTTDFPSGTPTRTGYTFNTTGGWNTQADGLGTSPTTLPHLAAIATSADPTVYAQWTVNPYQLTYNLNDGGDVTTSRNSGVANENVNFGLAISTAAHYTTVVGNDNAPTRTGYTFGGWYLEAACSNAVAATTMPATAKEIFAKWTVNPYQLTYNLNDGGDVTTNRNSGVASENVNFGLSISTAAHYTTAVSNANAPTRTGYTFGGWYLEAACSNAVAATTMPATAKEIFAKWTVNPYQLTYNLNDGGDATTNRNSGVASENVNFGLSISTAVHYTTAVSNANAPTRTGYTFGGWYLEAACNNAVAATTMTETGAEIFAQWTARGVTVSYESNGGTGLAGELTVGTYADTLATAPTTQPSKTGYTFAGWYYNSGLVNEFDFGTTPLDAAHGVSDYAGAPAAGDATLTLYTKWTANTYTLTFDKNGGDTDASPVSKPVTYDAAVGTVPSGSNAPAKTGYTFLGWSTASGTSNAVNFDASTVVDFANNKTVYAVWAANTGILLNFDANGGVAGTTQTKPVTYDAAVGTLPGTGSGAPTRTGYTFEGWSTSRGASNTVNFTSSYIVDFTSSKTVYAVWEIKTYTVTYIGNGHTSGAAPAATTHNHGSNATVKTQETLARDSHSFSGWNTAADGSGSAYAAGSAIGNITGNQTLYAQWTYNAPPPTDPPDDPDDPPRRPEDPDDDPDDPPVDPPTPPVVPPADPPESPEGGFTEPTDPEADSESGTTGTTTTVSKISGFDLDDMTKLEAQSGNIFNNLANGNVPLGGFYAKGAWSALDLILAIIAVILSVILSIGALGKRKDRQKKAGVGFMRSLAISAGIIVLILTVSIDDFSQPVTWVNQWTPLVGIVFALQIVLFAAYKITAARATASIGNADIDL